MRLYRLLALLTVPLAVASARPILIEAESFADHGGWKLDTQFIEIMGSPYLIAHGMGEAVEDATTSVNIPRTGTYRIWARTKDWVAHWEAEGAPGKFQLAIGDKTLETSFGTEGAEWHWQEGGSIELEAGETSIALRDLTGFDGRCDAILLSDDPEFTPDNTSEVLPTWRRDALGLPEAAPVKDNYDLVVVGGGYSGMGAAVSGARMGLKVALLQNRAVLGGNGSSEVRVWAMGNTPGGLYPVGDIIRELEDSASASPSPYEEWEDDKKEKIIRAEKNLDLFLSHHAFTVTMAEDNTIASVSALDTKTNEIIEFKGSHFVDATGHGYIGMWAGADRDMIDGGRMGMSNMWMWEKTGIPQDFPETPWALDLDQSEFPYPNKHHAQWFWESGYDKHPLNDLELIRDHNLRASYGAWNAIKNKGAYAERDDSGASHRNARMTWLAYVGGTRETQQLLGDVILTEEDVVGAAEFPDACVLTTWSIDLHYPKEQYLHGAPDNPFISVAVHGKGVDRKAGYPVPYRCFYSRNISNLFMAGRNVSVTHKALGTVRVMKTCGMMGVVVGKAAAICKEEGTTPRGVYEDHLPRLIELLEQPGNIRRASLEDEFFADTSVAPMAAATGLTVGIDRKKLKGIIIDDRNAELEGIWNEGASLKPFIHHSYRYAKEAGKSATFGFAVPRTGLYDVRIAYRPHENRTKAADITVAGTAEGDKKFTVDQTQEAAIDKLWHSLGTFRFEAGQDASVLFRTTGNGNTHIDCVQILSAQ